MKQKLIKCFSIGNSNNAAENVELSIVDRYIKS